MEHQDVFVGRQPIYNRKLEIIGYELLYRSSQANQADFRDSDLATTEVIVNSFMELGLETIVGRYPAFINLSRGFLTGEKPLPFPNKRVVLEILEDIEPDAQLIAGLRQLSRQGYIIALDDFVYRPELEPLVELAHIIKVDVLGIDHGLLEQRVKDLRRGKQRLLAEKVETQEDFERCQALGFDYFQGYFFCKPNIVKGKRPSANRLVLMNLLAELQRPETSIEKLEKLVAQDASLTYRLLRYANSPAAALRHKVESLRRAIVVIGGNTIKNWITLILYTRLEEKPRELILIALVRAKMCETLARLLKRDGLDRYFTVGLLSAMDALLDQPMAEVLEALPLIDEIKQALHKREGLLGATLQQVLHYERAEWDRLSPELEDGVYKQTYLDALSWAVDSLAALTAPVKAEAAAG